MFADLFWWFFAVFYFVAYFYVIILVIMDLFRDDKLAGGWKALWIIFLVFVPFLTGLVYLIVRGKGLAERSNAQRGQSVPEEDDYHPSASSSPAADIARAQALLEAGTISQGEFEALKSKALGNQFFG